MRGVATATPHRLAALSFVTAVFVAASVVVASGAQPAVASATLVSIALLGAGLVIGLPVLVVAAALGMVGAYSGAVGVDGGSGGLEVLVVAPALWCSVEAALRSMDLRPAVTADGAAHLSWVGVVAAVLVGTVAAGLVVRSLGESAPGGGLTFRLLSVGWVVVAAAAVALVGIRRAQADRSRSSRAVGSAGP
jgi:hypothetical protein